MSGLRGVASIGLVLVCVVAAGCTGGGQAAAVAGAPSDPSAPVAEFDAERGAITGVVTDDTLAPVGGATVVIEGPRGPVRTDPEGRFSFSFVTPGLARVVVAAPGFGEWWNDVQVRGGEVSEVHAQLVPQPADVAFHAIQEGSGRIMCGVAARPGTGVGVCQVVTGAVGGGGDDPRVDFPLSAANFSEVEALVLETQWQPNQVGAGGLYVAWENAQDWNELSSGSEARFMFGNVVGESPLRLVVTRAQIAQVMEGEDDTTYCAAFGACTIMGIAYAHSSTLGASAPVDAGVYVEQRFTHFVSEFFVDAPAPTYTALADG